MLTNYLRIAIRNLVKQRLYSLINVTGLAVGVAACVIVFVFLQHEFSYDGTSAMRTASIASFELVTCPGAIPTCHRACRVRSVRRWWRRYRTWSLSPGI